MSVFRLSMLPASEGDCLILSYGQTEASLRHIVVDGGRKATWPHLKKALAAIAQRGEAVELLLLSHIDADHIDGLVELVSDPDLPLVPKALWYNGIDQLKALAKTGRIKAFGIKAADIYSKTIVKKGWPLNGVAGGKAILVEDLSAPFEFAGLTLTLISPDADKLEKLFKDWRRALMPVVRRAVTAATGALQPFGKRPMPSTLDPEILSSPSNIDTTPPNGSSIAMIAEYDGRRVLLGADAHPDIVLQSIERIAGPGATLKVDLVKLPHHGSRANITRAIIEKLDCDRFAISTNGTVFGHPDPEAISRLLKFAPPRAKTLYFNYRSDRTEPWDVAALKAKYGYACVFPEATDVPLTIDI
ncbi:MBL fold metallo-hydrolase [Sphingomonas sp. RT2P30]|uniref:ComEC/Rec2 family competence protein n=1 Tax=Parasphingomonas halimpatiens TaxID=3096162 RepID=UPI002FC9A459